MLEFISSKLEKAKKKLTNCNITNWDNKLNKVQNKLKNVKKSISDMQDMDSIKLECERLDLEGCTFFIQQFFKEIQQKTDADFNDIQTKVEQQLDCFIYEISIIETVLNNENIDSLLTEFFKKFYFITNYPNEESLGKYIDKELAEIFNLLRTKFLGSAFERQMNNFLKQYRNGMAEFYSDEDIKSYFSELSADIGALIAVRINVSYVKKLDNYRIRFKADPEEVMNFIDPINDQSHILHFCTETARLSAIKVLQTVRSSNQFNPSDSFIFTDLRTLLEVPGRLNETCKQPQEIILNAFKLEESHSLLVIECGEKADDENAERKDLCDLYKDLSEIIEENSSKKLILIGDPKTIFSGLENITKSQEDKISFRDLEEASQTRVLEEIVLFQEAKLKLIELLDECTADKVFDQKILSDFLEYAVNNKDKDIKIGDTKAFSFIEKKRISTWL